jgi:hypothetical protein
MLWHRFLHTPVASIRFLPETIVINGDGVCGVPLDLVLVQMFENVFTESQANKLERLPLI